MLEMDDERRTRLMEAIDQLNWKYERDTVYPLALGTSQHGWEMRRERISGRYTTRLDEVMRVKAG